MRFLLYNKTIIIELNDCVGLPNQIKSITMSSNKKQRGRRDKQKRIEAQKEAQLKESELRAQQEAEDVRAQQELAIRRAGGCNRGGENITTSRAWGVARDTGNR